MNKQLLVIISLLLAVLLVGGEISLANASAASLYSTSGMEGTLLVTTLEDEYNNDGDCSLREAIQAATFNSSIDACTAGEVLTDTISFNVTGTITLSSYLMGGLSGGPIVIDGAGLITLSGNGSVRIFRIESLGKVVLKGLRIINGYGSTGYGGAIDNWGRLTVLNSTLDGNSAQLGGGIANHGTVHIIDSLLSNNSSEVGGGIENNGTMTITNCIFSGNDSAIGGGVANSGEMELNHTILLSNHASNNGGGISNSGSLAITNSTLSENGSLYGGGLYNNGTLIIGGSIITGNIVEVTGGGIYNHETMTITTSTLDGNIANHGGGVANGGILNLINTTLSNNTAGQGGGVQNGGSMIITQSALYSNNGDDGGGIYNGGTISINNSTLSGNIATLGGGVDNIGNLVISSSTFSGNTAGQFGSSIVNEGVATITNTIVARTFSVANCWGLYMTDGGHNISSDSTCGFSPANGSMPSTDPLLRPLQDNGGLTFTHALLEASPAIDAGDDAQCPHTDQRGILRPLDGNEDGIAICDIGSFESGLMYIYLPLVGH